MIGTVRKHSKAMWGVIIAAMVIGLVYSFNPASRFGGRGGGGGQDLGSIDGQKITSQEFRDAGREIVFAEFLKQKQWPERNPADGDIYDRVLLIRKMQEMHIEVPPDAVAAAAANVLHSLQVPSMDEFQKILGNRATIEDFENYLSHQLGVEQMARTIGVTGVLMPESEARMLYERARQPMDVQAAFFSASNYLALAQANPNVEELRDFYTNNLARYRLPERMQVSYVFYNVTNYLHKAEKTLTNINEIVDQEFGRLGTNVFKDVKTPEETKARIRELVIRQTAMMDAQRDINDFATRLVELPIPNTDSLETFARSNGAVARVTEPFDDVNGPKDLDVGPNFPKFAFQLTTNEMFAGPIQGEDGFYEVAYKAHLPEETPDFEAVRDRVASDYKFQEAITYARQAGERLAEMITNSPTKTFTEVCAAAKVPVVAPPPFSLDTQELTNLENHVSLDQFKLLVFSTTPGKTSGFIPTLEGGVVVHVDPLTPIDPAKMKEELPQFWANVRSRREQEAYGAWISINHQRALPGFTLLEQQKAPGAQGPEQ